MTPEQVEDRLQGLFFFLCLFLFVLFFFSLSSWSMLLLFQTASSLLHVASPSVTPPTSHSSLPAHCVVRERAISVRPPHLLSSS